VINIKYLSDIWYIDLRVVINPLNAELNPICHLLALLVAHPVFHISRIKVNISEMSTGYLTILFVEPDIKGAMCSKAGGKGRRIPYSFTGVVNILLLCGKIIFRRILK